MFSYKYVETPLRKKKWSSGNSITIIKGIIALLVSLLMLLGIDKILKDKIFLGRNSNKALAWWVDKDGNYIEDCHLKGSFTKESIEDCFSSRDQSKKRVFFNWR